MPSTPQGIRFEVRGLRVERSENEYTTTFFHRATIVALGDSAITAQPYLVAVRSVRVSGGDPDVPSRSPADGLILVVNGVGDFELWGGSRTKRGQYLRGETWEPGKVEVSVVGFAPMFALPNSPVRTP